VLLSTPPVLEFHSQGNLLAILGRPGHGFDWAETRTWHLCDKDENVWIGGADPPSGHLRTFKDGISSCMAILP